ncbi:MAG: SMC-Scp complex subunit ScpB [Pirellulales bacterium]
MDITPSEHDAGLELDQLSSSLRSLLHEGDDPYARPADATADPLLEAANAGVVRTADEDAQCETSPRTILEALLFVGTPDHRPIAADTVAALMRGVSADEIDQAARELEAGYRAAACPYTIEITTSGYRLTLRSEYAGLRDALYGKVREARLSPAAIDVLSIVAYNQLSTAEQIESLRGAASGAILGQLVRRQLLRIDRDPVAPRTARYATTERFLTLFHLAKLEDLPRGVELER